MLLDLNKPGFSAIIDDADWPIVAPYTWIVMRARCGRLNYYAKATPDGKNIYLHRLLLNAPPGVTVDHFNGNGLDNRRENLRLASRSQNNANRETGRLGFRGVERRPCGSFRAKISEVPERRHLGKTLHLGTFATAEEAARAYDRAAYARWGDFARLNLPVPA